MRLLYLKLINYKGIYNGLKLNEIEIDFSKCINNITVIIGTNGSGKSTIMDALHPLPDPGDNIIDKLPGGKEYIVSDNNCIYKCKVIQGVKSNGDRETTKAYIYKTNQDGTVVNLNPNGNISSYKDILESELSLDPCYLFLSQLSADNRGLVDKIPSQRKKIVSSITANIEFYNAINKTLSKRASVFKSMLNNISYKIDNLGDENKLQLSIKNIETNIKALQSQKQSLYDKMIEHKSKVDLLDPDKRIQNTYDEIYNRLLIVNDNIKSNELSISSLMNSFQGMKFDKEDNITVVLNKIKDDCKNVEIDLGIIESQINSLLNQREIDAKVIQDKTAKLDSLRFNGDIDSIKQKLNMSKQNMSYYKSIIDKIGITTDISKDEFIIGLNTLNQIKESINVFKSGMSMDIFEEAVTYIEQGTYPDISSLYNSNEEIDEDCNSINIELVKYNTLLETSSKLEFRPCECKIDECNFIKDALLASKQNPKQHIEELSARFTNLQDEKGKNRLLINRYSDVIEYINSLKSLIREINNHLPILNKLPIEPFYVDIISSMRVNIDFKQLDEISKYIEQANVIDLFKNEVLNYKTLENQYSLLSNKEETINNLILEIDNLNNNLSKLTNEITEKNNIILENKKKLSQYKSVIQNLEYLLELMTAKNKLNGEKSELISRFNTIKDNITTIKDSITLVNDIQGKINTLESQINPLTREMEKIRYSIQLLEEYTNELALYSAKFNKIEILKKHSTTSEGIQTLFINAYMGKTLSMVNDLLKMMFDGEFVLGQYTVNEDEFRIPCFSKEDGIPHDDISSMSLSQRCMISMIISFVLLKQSSTKYNILKLDEIDGGLDNINRGKFVIVLEELLRILEVEQCIIISHNNEINLSNCDIIQLKMSEYDTTNVGNVIFKY